MAAAQRRKQLPSAAETVTSYLALCLAALLLVNFLRESTVEAVTGVKAEVLVRGRKFGGGRQPCAEIYVVGEGETLHTISDKCGDPFIVEQNPHVNDPDDVYPGLVLKITHPGRPRT